MNPSVFVSSGTLTYMPSLGTSCVHSFLSLAEVAFILWLLCMVQLLHFCARQGFDGCEWSV
jgi:hypothetical protein